MNKIRIRFSFLFKLVAFLAVLGIVLFFVHRYQVSKQTEFLLKRAREAAELPDPTDAVRYYTQYTSVRKDDAQARVELAKLFEKFGAAERAFFYYEEALRIDPSLTESRKSIVDAALAIRREKDARDQIVGHLLKAEPENAELHWKLGICEERLGDFSAARQHYEKAIELNKSEPKYAIVYADLLARRFNQSKNAREALDQMVSQAGKDPMAFVSRGEWLLRERATLSQGSRETRDQLLETAWQDAKAALDLKPDDPTVATFFSSIAVEKKEFELARSAIVSAMDKQPEDPRLFSELARIELGLGDAEKAIAALQKGQAASPGDFDLMWTETQLQLDMGRMKEVERLISEMKSRISRPEALTLISYLDARVLAYQGKWQEAASLLEQFRSQFDRSQGILKQVDFLLATCYRNLGNAEQELASLRRCINSDPLFTPARDALAVALFRAGKVQEALNEYNQIDAQSNASPSSILNYARVLFLDGLAKNVKDKDWSQLNNVLAKLDNYPEIADDVAILRAELLLNQDQRDEAEKLIAARIKENNKSPQLHQALISIRSLSQDWDQVRLALKEAGEALGDTVALRLERARFLLRRDRDQVDKQQLDQLANPNDTWDDAQRAELATGFATLFLSLREMDRAMKLATSVAESPSGQTDLSVHMMLFDIASMTDNSELMTKSLKKVKEIDKTGALWRVGDAIRLNLEAKKVKEGEPKRASQLYQEAIRQLTEAAVIRPAWSRIPRLKGEIYDEQGNADSALESYVEAINLGEYAPEVVSRTLSMLLQKGRFFEADNIIRKTQDQKSPVSSELSRMASQIYMQMQDYDRAVGVAIDTATRSDSQEDHLWLAQVYAATGKDAQAEQEFRTSIAKDPSAPAPWVTLILYYARKENREAALSALADAEAQIRESDRDDALAQAYQFLGDLPNADKFYQASIAKNPDNPVLLRRYAEFLLLANAPRLAEPVLSKLIAPEIETNDIDRAWGRRSLALIIGLRGSDEAVKQARDLLNANAVKLGFTVEDKRVLARILASRDHAPSTDEAVELLREITQNAAKFSLEDNYLLATVYKKRKDWNRYFSTMRAIMGNGGGDDAAYVYDYAQTLIAQKQTEEGQLWLDRLRKIAPQALGSVAVEAQILYGQGNYGKIEELLNANKDLPGGLEAMATLAERLAQLLERDNKPDVADKFWKFAETSFAELTVNEVSKRTALAGFLARTGNIDRALEELSGKDLGPDEFGEMVQGALQAPQLTPEGAKRMIPEILTMVEKHPENTLLLVALGDYYSWAGDIEQARAAYRKILEKDAKFIPALNNLAMILAASNVGVDEAVQAIDQAVNLSGPTDYLLDTRGIVKLAAGDLAGAEADLRQSIAGASRADRYFHLAQILMAQGRKEDAKQALETAQKEGVSKEVLHPIERAAYQKLVDGVK